MQNVLNHSNKISLCLPESQQQNTPQKSETNGNTSPRSDVSTDSKSTPPESQSPLHWLADLAEQKAREEKKGTCLLYYANDFGGDSASDNTVELMREIHTVFGSAKSRGDVLLPLNFNVEAAMPSGGIKTCYQKSH